MDWIDVTGSENQCRIFVNRTANLLKIHKVRFFLSSLTTVSFSVRTICHVLCQSVMSLLRFELFLNFGGQIILYLLLFLRSSDFSGPISFSTVKSVPVPLCPKWIPHGLT